MSAEHARRSEGFVTLESAAEFYRVEITWIHEVYSRGLLGPGERHGASIAVPASELDRLASVLRLHRHLGLDLDAVAALLDPLFRAR
jgi:hypothetical protein